MTITHHGGGLQLLEAKSGVSFNVYCIQANLFWDYYIADKGSGAKGKKWLFGMASFQAAGVACILCNCNFNDIISCYFPCSVRSTNFGCG